MGVTPIWPQAAERSKSGELSIHGIGAAQLLEQFGSPLYVMDIEEVRQRARHFVQAAANAFANANTHVSYAGKAFLSKRIVRIMIEEGMLVDTCSMGEMRIALAAGAPGRRLVLHGNNKSDEEIELAIQEGFAKIVVDEPQEPERIARIARRLGKRARVMLRVTSGIHAGGHEYISTAHEDQKFGVPLLAAHTDACVCDHDAPVWEAMDAIADGPAIAVLKSILSFEDQLELVGIHSHIGSNIHDADAFIQAASRMMLLRKTLYHTDAYVLPEVDLGGGYSVAYTDGEDSMNVDAELARLAQAVHETNRRLGMPAPVISFEPGRWIVAPAGITLYQVGTVKKVNLPQGSKDSEGNPIEQRTYVSVDGGMSDNIRPALYGAQYTALLANRQGSEQTRLSRVVGMHCESGDIVVHECQLPEDVQRGDVLAVPVTGAYGRTMASNYNQVLIPAVVGVDAKGASVMIRRQRIEDLLDLDED